MPYILPSGQGIEWWRQEKSRQSSFLLTKRIFACHRKTFWKVPEDVTLTVPIGDYRDRLPTRPEDIAEQYASIVKVGTTFWLAVV